jgi:hypothetical protein
VQTAQQPQVPVPKPSKPLILQELTELTGLDLAPPSPRFNASNLILAYQNLPSNLEFSSWAQPVKQLICIGIAEHTCANPRVNCPILIFCWFFGSILPIISVIHCFSMAYGMLY